MSPTLECVVYDATLRWMVSRRYPVRYPVMVFRLGRFLSVHSFRGLTFTQPVRLAIKSGELAGERQTIDVGHDPAVLSAMNALPSTL